MLDLRARASALLCSSVLFASPVFANSLANSSFEIVGPNGPLTVNVTAAPGPAGISAADSWGVFHNTGPATTRTEILPTSAPSSLGVRMIHVDADRTLNGLVQTTGPVGSGPSDCIASAWVHINGGTVGMGAGNGGNTNPFDATTSTAGAWVHLQTLNGSKPCNEIVFYSVFGPADFFVDDAEILPLQEVDQDRVPLEYSNDIDERAIAGGDNHNGLDPGQVLYTEPFDVPGNGMPRNTTDFFPGIEDGDEPDAQVDALAHGADGLFQDVLKNRANLLISLDTDPGGAQPIALWFEDAAGGTGVQYTQRDLNNPNAVGDLDDLDAVELWGPIQIDDAFYFSLDFDFGNVSVWHYLAGVPTAYVLQSDIFTAIAPLGFQGDNPQIDLDALMVQDTGTQGVWDEGDEIIFSIQAVANWDGGELVHMKYPASGSFVFHGGHLWDTAHAIIASFPVDTEEVDALEAACRDTDGDTICDFEDPCPIYANTLPLNGGGNCGAFPADPNSDCQPDGVPTECQCGDCDQNGRHQAADAFGIAGCVVAPATCSCATIAVSDTDNNSLLQAADAFNVATVVGNPGLSTTLTCPRRP